MTPAEVKAEIHALDARVEALRQQRAGAQVDTAVEAAHATLRSAISDISVGAPKAAEHRDRMPEIKAAYTRALANLRQQIYAHEAIAFDLRQLARKVMDARDAEIERAS